MGYRGSFVRSLFYLFIFVCSIHLVSAQVFRFNGQFNDPSGQSVGGTTFVSAVMVQLFDHPLTGQSGYIQMEPSVQVVDGLFSIDIGPGLPDLKQFRYLELTISGETLNPRVPILIAPLSLQSMNSERFGKLTTDEFLQIVGNAILDESNFITDSLTTGLTILSNDIQINSQEIGSLNGRLTSVELNAGSNAALLNLSQALQSQDLRIQDLELVVGDSQSQLQALSSQLGALSSDQDSQGSVLSLVQSDVLLLDSSLAQLQTTVNLLQGELSQTPVDVLTSGEGSFSTSTVLHFAGSEMQLVIHSVLTDENAADKIVLFNSDGLEAFKVDAGGMVTANTYFGDGSGLVNLNSSQISDFVSAVQSVSVVQGLTGGVLYSSHVGDFSTAVDGRIQSALTGANFDSSQISDFESAVDARLLLNPVTSTDISDFETAVLAQSPNLVVTSGQVLDLSTAIDIQLGLSSLSSAQISDMDTAIDSRLSSAIFQASQISDFSTAANAALSVSKAGIGLGNVDNVQQLPASYLETILNPVSDSNVPSSKAVADHVGAAITSAESNYEPANPDLVNHLGDVSNPHSVTKDQVGLGNVDDVQQLPMTYLNTVVTDVNNEVPSSGAVMTYVQSELGTIDRTAVGLGSVQNIDVTTTFTQNPDARIETHKIQGLPAEPLYLINNSGQGITVSDSTGFAGIGTWVPTEMLDVSGRVRMRESTQEVGEDGTIRWNGFDLEVKTGGSWTSLTGYGDSLAQSGVGTNSFLGQTLSNVSDGTFSSVVGGDSNTAAGTYSFVGGGRYNTAQGFASNVAGGENNTVEWQASHGIIAGGRYGLVQGDYGFIGAGHQSTVTTTGGVVVGGLRNQSLNQFSSVVGGENSTAAGKYSFVGGGKLNIAGAFQSSIVGGLQNSIDVAATHGVIAGGRYGNLAGEYAFIGSGHQSVVATKGGVVVGGLRNQSLNEFASVVGGEDSTAAGRYSFVGGGKRNVANSMATVVGGGELNFIAQGTPHSVISGGKSNWLSGSYGFIGSGKQSLVLTEGGVVVGGFRNQVLGEYASVVGGQNNTAAGWYSFTAGGEWNRAIGDRSFVGAGAFNEAHGIFSTISGGKDNIVTGAFSVIPGGRELRVDGTDVFAFNGTGSPATVPVSVTSAAIFLVDRFGVGTTEPSTLYRMDIMGDLNVNGNILQNGGAFGSVFTDNTTNAIYSSGNLGIGTNIVDPQNALVVDGGIQLIQGNQANSVNGTLRYGPNGIQVHLDNEWVDMKSAPTTLSLATTERAAPLASNGIIVLGNGSSPPSGYTSRPESFDSPHTFDARPVLPRENGNVSNNAVFVNGKIYVAGGYEYSSGQNTSDLHIFDIASNTWTQGTSMSRALRGNALVTVGNEIYSLGGQDQTNARTGHVEIYSIANDTWTTAHQDMFLAPIHGGAAFYENGLIYYVGGEEDGGFVNTVQSADPLSPPGEWTINAPAPANWYAAPSVYYQGFFYAIGNYISNAATLYRYDPNQNSWVTLTSNASNIMTYGSAFAIDGYIYVFRSTGSYRYDIANDSWENLGLSMPHSFGEAGYVSDGKTGYNIGSSASGARDSVNEFIPAASTPLAEISNYKELDDDLVPYDGIVLTTNASPPPGYVYMSDTVVMDGTTFHLHQNNVGGTGSGLEEGLSVLSLTATEIPGFEPGGPQMTTVGAATPYWRARDKRVVESLVNVYDDLRDEDGDSGLFMNSDETADTVELRAGSLTKLEISTQTVAINSERTEFSGQITLGTEYGVSSPEGTIRWTGTDLEVRKGASWVSLTDSLDPNNVNITSGTINGTSVGLSVQSSGKFTDLSVTQEFKLPSFAGVCDGTREGVLRFNTGTKKMELCDGSSFQEVALGAGGGGSTVRHTAYANFGTTANDGSQNLYATNDGGAVIAGYHDAAAVNEDATGFKGLRNFWIIKVDSNASIQWQTHIGSSQHDQTEDIIQSSDGGYVVVGNTNGTPSLDLTGTKAGNSDSWIVKLDSTGSLEWETNMGSNGDDSARAVSEASDGHFIVAHSSYGSGSLFPTNQGSADIWVTKLDKNNGDILWKQNFGGGGEDLPYEVVVDGSGDIYVGGYNTGTGTHVSANYGAQDVWVLKLNSAGSLLWETSVGSTQGDVGYGMDLAHDGGVVIAGHSSASAVNSMISNVTAGSFDFFVTKIDANGDVTWGKLYGGAAGDSADGICAVSDGGYVVVGVGGNGSAGTGVVPTYSEGGNNAGWLIKVDGNGRLMASKAYGKDGSIRDCEQLNNGSIMTSGFTGGAQSNHMGIYRGGSDIWVIMLDGSHRNW